MSIEFPNNVKSFDWTAAPMEGPPKERTMIGYFCWCDTSDENDYRTFKQEFYVLPNGGAEILILNRPFSSSDKEEVEVKVETFSPGSWEPEYPVTDFGSRGGTWIKAK